MEPAPKLEIDGLSEQDLQDLVEKLSEDVIKEESRVQSLKAEVEDMQLEIQKQQQVRSEFTKQLFRAEEVSPLVEQCLQVRQILGKKQNDLEAVARGTSRSCKDIKQLERKLQELESGLDLELMGAENKENPTTVEELKVSLELKVGEHRQLKDRLAQIQARVVELHSCQAQRAGGRCAGGSSQSQRTNMDTELDKFIRKTCQKNGLQLQHAQNRTSS